MPSDPSSQRGGTPDPGLAFLEAWAALVLPLDGSPAADDGPGGSLSAALSARDEAAGSSPLRVLFARGEARVAGRTLALAPESRARKLAEVLEACGIAGVLFEPGLRARSLAAFALQVRESARRAALRLDDEAWDGEPVEHVHVLQRRFQEAFDDALNESAHRPRTGLRAVAAADRSADVDDDVAALEVELAALPYDLGLALESLDDAPEALGVYLHLLATFEDDAEAVHLHAPLARLVREAGARGRDVLAAHLAPGSSGERARERLTRFLCDFDLLGVLIEHGAFDLELAARQFPEGFPAWLARLDLARADDHARLCELLAHVGPQRALRAGPRLFGEARLGDPARAAAILARPHPALIPVARLLLARGVPALTERVARYVRELDLPLCEARLFALLEDAELPAEVLAGLLDPPRTPAARESLRTRAVECLCELVESAEPAGAGRRLAAARLLAELGGARVRARLEAVLREAREGDPLARELRRALEERA